MSVRNWVFKQSFKVFLYFFILISISLIPPLSDKFAVEDENVDGVEEDNVVFDGHTVEKYSQGIEGVSKV